MSFNPNDNNIGSISRTNYEEYFLLYSDNELSEKDRLSVEAFVLAHPDLQAELDLFLSTKLPAEDINLQNKEALLADSMKLNAIDESLLLYLDNELSGKEKKSIEEKLAANKTFELQYQALLKTKLKLEEIVYPYKRELYHYEEKRRFVFSTHLVRIAAAVIILLGMGIFWITYQPKSPDSVVKINPGSEGNEKKPSTDKESSNDNVATKTVEPTIKVGETDDATNITRHIEKEPVKKVNKQEQAEDRPSMVETNPNTIAKTVEENKPEQEIGVPKNTVVSGNTPATSQQQTVNNKNVTSPSIASLNDQTTESVAAVQATVVEPGDEKKSKLKGFLRKATRFIERRTNISTTNENNELLIGAVAIQL